jgi:hypothetical protein
METFREYMKNHIDTIKEVLNEDNEQEFIKTKTKRENYRIDLRLQDLKDIVEIQCSKGNYDQGHYMRGMANGLMLAWHIIAEPYGSNVLMFDENYKAEYK